MSQYRMTIFLVASVFATFLLGASLASADYAIAGEWFGNRGPTVNIPAGQFDETCPPLTSVNVPFATPTPVTFPDPAIPLPASQWVPGPCGRAQKHAFTATIPGNSSPTLIPANAIAVVAHSGIPARSKKELKQKAISHLRKLQKLSGRVMKYFKHPKIAYASECLSI